MSEPMKLTGAQEIAVQSWVQRRLVAQITAIFEGLTDPQLRWERIRQVISANGFGPVILGRHDGKPETYAQFFERVFGEPLDPTKARARAHADAQVCSTPDPQPGDLFT